MRHERSIKERTRLFIREYLTAVICVDFNISHIAIQRNFKTNCASRDRENVQKQIEFDISHTEKCEKIKYINYNLKLKRTFFIIFSHTKEILATHIVSIAR